MNLNISKKLLFIAVRKKMPTVNVNLARQISLSGHECDALLNGVLCGKAKARCSDVFGVEGRKEKLLKRD